MRGKIRLLLLIICLALTVVFLSTYQPCKGLTASMVLGSLIHLDILSAILYIFGSLLSMQSCILAIACYVNQVINTCLLLMVFISFFIQEFCIEGLFLLGTFVCILLQIYYLVYLTYFMKFKCRGDAFPFEERRLQQASDKVVSFLVEGDISCSKCGQEIEEGGEGGELPCGHVFHKICVMNWLKNHRSCPICKIVIVTN